MTRAIQRLQALSAPSRIRLSLNIVALMVATAAFAAASSFHPLARYLPAFAASACIVAASGSTLRDLWLVRRFGTAIEQYVTNVGFEQQVESDGTPDEVGDALTVRAAVRFCVWVLCFAATTLALGLYLATAVFILLFLRIEARTSIRFASIGAISTLGLLYALNFYLNTRWPQGFLF